MRTTLLALALLAAGAASAQPANTSGLFVQLALDGQSLNFNEDDFDETDDGGGLALRAGYGVSRVVTLYLGASGARVDGETNGVINDEYDWAAGEIGARFNLLPSARLVPYLDVALRGVAATYDEADLEFRGGGIALGGGASYFVSPTVALDAALRIGGGGFEEVQLGGLSADIDPDDFGYGEGRLSLGVTFYPLR
jgi:hypothetical protein